MGQVRFWYHPLYELPVPEGHRFPMAKYGRLRAGLKERGRLKSGLEQCPEPAAPEDICRVHDSFYMQSLMDLTLTERDWRAIGFPASALAVERERRLVQGTLEASEWAFKGGLGINLAGGTHHAGIARGEGFCLLNDLAIAAGYLIHHYPEARVLVLDLDVHQGNGTAECLAQQPRTFTISLHGRTNYPFRKAVSSLDVPLEKGCSDVEYLFALDEALEEALRFRPNVLLYQGGVDVLHTDRFGHLSLTLEGCVERDRRVAQWCRTHGLGMAYVLGGGYTPDLDAVVQAHSECLEVCMAYWNFLETEV